MREFEVATGRAALVRDEVIPYKLGDRELKAKPPTVGQLALFIQGGREGGLRSVTTMLELLSDVSDDRDWKYIHELLRDGLDITVLSEITNYLVGEWSGRPTMQSPVSSPTPSDTGPPSTEKPSATVSTISPTPSTDSAMSSSGG